MTKRTKRVPKPPAVREPRCFACDGSGTRCNRCGETESACGCEEGFDPGPCDDCKGTGK